MLWAGDGAQLELGVFSQAKWFWDFPVSVQCLPTPLVQAGINAGCPGGCRESPQPIPRQLQPGVLSVPHRATHPCPFCRSPAGLGMGGTAAPRWFLTLLSAPHCAGTTPWAPTLLPAPKDQPGQSHSGVETFIDPGCPGRAGLCP